MCLKLTYAELFTALPEVELVGLEVVSVLADDPFELVDVLALVVRRGTGLALFPSPEFVSVADAEVVEVGKG